MKAPRAFSAKEYKWVGFASLLPALTFLVLGKYFQCVVFFFLSAVFLFLSKKK